MGDAVWVVGDVQGYLDRLKTVLRGAGLIDDYAQWSGGDATLAVLGDLVDKGPDGVGVIEFLMQLDTHVTVVIGNHDMLLLAARKFPQHFEPQWRDDGGVPSDLERLSHHHVQWLTQLPAMVVHSGALMVHADALFYLEYGQTIDSVNAAFREILRSDDPTLWQHLLEQFGEHRAFLGRDGCANLDRFLATFGATRLIHGHTPVPRLLQQPAESVRQAYIYCDGRCVNVDPGLYLGGPGFGYELKP